MYLYLKWYLIYFSKVEKSEMGIEEMMVYK
jgi:hypothetical protein